MPKFENNPYGVAGYLQEKIMETPIFLIDHKKRGSSGHLYCLLKDPDGLAAMQPKPGPVPKQRKSIDIGDYITVATHGSTTVIIPLANITSIEAVDLATCLGTLNEAMSLMKTLKHIIPHGDN